jgi:Na+/H+ antiporter NhaD/arsenite permease-like protein
MKKFFLIVTMLFFFGVIMCVGGLGFVGYLEAASHLMYGDLGASTANILIGLLSAVVDNIPIMVAVLQMNPDMNTGQWLLVTLTAGVGGSLLSVGSAAGVAMFGAFTSFGKLGALASSVARAWSPLQILQCTETI